MDLILTSPPYAGAQKYVRSTSLSLGWLDLAASSGLRKLESKTIGCEHYPTSELESFLPTGVVSADDLLAQVYTEYPLRAHIAGSFCARCEQACRRRGEFCVPVAIWS